MKRLLGLLALCAVGVVGCDTEKQARNLMDCMVYMKDFRSNICFAAYRLGSGSIDTSSLTNVPCTPAVEALLVNKKPPASQPSCSRCAGKKLQPEKMEQK